MSDNPLATHAAGSTAAAGATGSADAPGHTPVATASVGADELAACTARWLTSATDPNSADTGLFAKLIAARDTRHELALLGLPQAAWQALLARHFAQAPESTTLCALPPTVIATEHAAFVGTLHALLLTYASPSVAFADADCLATIIAHACLRPDHLWRDLGLRGRDDVTWMLTRYFPTLVERNVDNLRWKKFLAQQRALSLGLTPGPAPGCPGCEDYEFCFVHHA